MSLLLKRHVSMLPSCPTLWLKMSVPKIYVSKMSLLIMSFIKLTLFSRHFSLQFQFFTSEFNFNFMIWLSLWINVLFQNISFKKGSNNKTRPMRPWWRDYLRVKILLDLHYWYSRWCSQCDRRTDGLTDWWTNVLSYRDAIMQLVSLVNFLWHLFARKYWFPLFFTKAWPTNQPTDGPTDRRTDGQTRL